MPTTKTKDFDIRAALTKTLIDNGIERRDIRHEIPLDTSSSEGRADMVVLTSQKLFGFEIKSGSDTLDRCDRQMISYAQAFDGYGIISDTKHSEKLKHEYRHVFYDPTENRFSENFEWERKYGGPTILHHEHIQMGKLQNELRCNGAAPMAQ
jgi:hypothetical protein